MIPLNKSYDQLTEVKSKDWYEPISLSAVDKANFLAFGKTTQSVIHTFLLAFPSCPNCKI